jgi:hypothetical protein
MMFPAFSLSSFVDFRACFARYSGALSGRRDFAPDILSYVF